MKTTGLVHSRKFILIALIGLLGAGVSHAAKPSHNGGRGGFGNLGKGFQDDTAEGRFLHNLQTYSVFALRGGEDHQKYPEDKALLQRTMKDLQDSPLVPSSKLETLYEYLTTTQPMEVFDEDQHPVKLLIPYFSQILGDRHLPDAAEFLVKKLRAVSPFQKPVPTAQYAALRMMLLKLTGELAVRRTYDGSPSVKGAVQILRNAFAERYQNVFKPGSEKQWAKLPWIFQPVNYVAMAGQLKDPRAFDAAYSYANKFLDEGSNPDKMTVGEMWPLDMSFQVMRRFQGRKFQQAREKLLAKIDTPSDDGISSNGGYKWSASQRYWARQGLTTNFVTLVER